MRCRVAGVTFAPGYPNNLADLARRCAVDAVPLELVRDLDNGHDFNAVAVCCEDRPLGHLPADIAAEVGPRMDAGHRYQARAVFVAVRNDKRKRPGLEIELQEVAG
jgi:hypothetical protein